MPELSLILFDLNGVLYQYRREIRIARLAAMANRAPEAIRHAIWDTGFEDSGDTGAMDAAAYLRGFGERIGYDLSEQEWTKALRASVTPITDMLGLLPYIRPSMRCAVLTNNNLLVQRHFADLFPEAAQRVRHQVCVSAEFGVRKPDPDCYLRCLGKLGASPAETWFIDDSADNVAGARRAGLMTHQYRDVKRFTAELRRRKLLSR